MCRTGPPQSVQVIGPRAPGAAPRTALLDAAAEEQLIVVGSRAELDRAGTVFALARVKQDLLARLESFGLAEKIGADRLFPTANRGRGL